MTIPAQFTLQPFFPCPWVDSIEGTITRSEGNISCHYRITADWNYIEWPAINSVPRRSMRLWENTCCELFMASPGKGNYLEINVSPSGDWNCFEFQQYRTGMQEETKLIMHNFASSPDPDLRVIHVKLNGTNEIMKESTIEVGIAVVIRSKVPVRNSRLSDSETDQESDLYYYSLQAQNLQPDFHDRAGFQVILEKNQ